MLDHQKRYRPGRTLISDDDEFFRVAISKVLHERNGFTEVIETSSFGEAVNKLAIVGRIDIGLFDLNMLGMENRQDLATLRREFPDMLLVVVSASRRREDILMSLDIGAHGYIHKGLGVGELSRAVDLICEGQVYVPPFLPGTAVVTPLGEPDIDTDFVVEKSDPQPADTALSEAPTSSSGATRRLLFSPRQREIVDLLIAGKSNKDMARALNLSEGTIKFHMSAVMRLLGVNSRVEAAIRAMKVQAD